MKLTKPTAVNYDSTTTEVIIRFADGSKSSWPICLLEMVKYDGTDWVTIQPTDDSAH